MSGWLQEAEARAENATPGPWSQGMIGDRLIAEVDYSAAFGLVTVSAERSDDGVAGIADAAFIAEARTDVPRLCELVRELGNALSVVRIGLLAQIEPGPEHYEVTVCTALALFREAIGEVPDA